MRILSLALLLCGAAAAGATDFYVDPVNGSNAGNGSAANPWRTLQAVVDADLVQSRNWSSLPYTAPGTLVTVNAGAPVKAGDTVWLRSGYHGVVTIQGLYNASPITVAAQPGHTPRLRSLLVRAAQNWVFRGLSISPSHALPLTSIDIVSVDDHNFFGPSWDIEVSDSDVFTVTDSSAWTETDWMNASSGIGVDSDRVTIRGNRVRNVRFGISSSGDGARIQENLIDGFSADGMRGLGNDSVYEYNRVQNNYVEDPPDPNHDDGFQSWSNGPGGVGTGEVRNVVLRGNVFVNHQNPAHPLRTSMQAIGCFDGFFVNWTVENNVVITDHWHGISFLGMRDSRIVNNTVIDLVAGSPGPPWIAVNPHKNGTPSSNVIVRNNLATDFDAYGTNVTSDHNVEFTMANAGTYFVAPPFDLHLRPGTNAVDTGNAALAPPLDVEKVARPQGAGFDLGAYERFVPTLAIGAVSVPEGNFGQASAVLPVTLSGAAGQTVTVSFATAPGTAAAGTDYVPASGALTFPPGTTARSVSVSVLGDLMREGNEAFAVSLASPVNATLGAASAQATIVDDDPVPTVTAEGCAVAEGNAGNVPCVGGVSLSNPNSQNVIVNWTTNAGSATPGTDYVATGGVLTFVPGDIQRPASAAVIGDTAVEADESFTLSVTNATNATVGNGQAPFVILDDDAPSLAREELAHGSSRWADLAAAGGVADEDFYRFAPPPRSAYEVVVDGTSGDVAPDVRLERLAADNVTVQQTATASGTGTSLSLRWENTLASPVVGPHLRVRSASCGTACGLDDVYRIRAYDTTYAIPRFNNSATQGTVVVLQNRSPRAVNGHLHFWDAAGVLLLSHPFALPARGTLAQNATNLPGLAGRSGSITVSNDGGYADLTGKAVSLEPATGFSFDSPMAPRLR
ncbi:MAG: Calx-beta domain-containing protein [Vicinamibacteria bacterium]